MNKSDKIEPRTSQTTESHSSPAVITEDDFSPPRGNPFPIVGIGASAGGLEAFEQLLTTIPDDTGMAFVLVQHLDPHHHSLLTHLLTPATGMPVVTVNDGMQIEPNHVYVIPPNTSIELTDGSFRLFSREPGLHLPIDIFFRSLAKVQGSRAIGIVLSGNASDGALGLRAIKAECGLTFAQDDTARFAGMPHNAIASGAVDVVLPPEEIGQRLRLLSRHPYLVPAHAGVAASETLPDGDGELHRIFELLQAATKVDFSHYKHTTVRRRISRRMMVLRIDAMEAYRRYAERHDGEVRELYRDLLISVTSFFRDPGTFQALTKLLLTTLTDHDGDQPVRIWVPGCATGEEVYSLAISLTEAMQEENLTFALQFFGTDINELAIERARNGAFSQLVEEDVSPERLRRFFTRIDSGYQINKNIRETCIFARHDVTRDPPFSHLHVVSCRNVLIYLDNVAQKRVLPIFHYALKPSGLLMLGSAESTSIVTDLFAALDRDHHIYARRVAAARISFEPLAGGGVIAEPTSPTRPQPVFTSNDLGRRVDRVLQAKYSPSAVLINGDFQILQFRGHTRPYLDPSPGEATLNLLHMAKESLVLPLRRAVAAAVEKNAPIRETGLLVGDAEKPEQVTLDVMPIAVGITAEQCYLIVFNPDGEANAKAAERLTVEMLPVDEQVQALERELGDTRQYLRHITEEYAAHAEELQATAEEARSANEELQSAIEELGTTKEELQSSNEELTTVNEELHSRNQELGAINGDLKNLLSAVPLAIIMVDQDLRVRRFNSAAEPLLNLGPLDLGRPVGHIRGRIETPGLESRVRMVIDSLTTHSEEMRDTGGHWYSVSIRPYRTLEDYIAGAVITFQDIDPLKRGLQAAEEAREYAENMIETVREPLVVLDSDLRVKRATVAFYDTFLVSREETVGRFLYDLGNGQWDRPRLRELLGQALFGTEGFHDFEVQHEFPHISIRTMQLNARRIPRPDSHGRMLLLAIEDVTELQQIAEIRFRRLFETAKDGIVIIDVETESVLDVNAYLLELSGFAREDIVGKRLADAPPFAGVPEGGSLIEETKDSEIVRHADMQFRTASGEFTSVDLVGNRYQMGGQTVIQLNIRDISAKKQASKALRESEERFRLFVESVQDYAMFQMDCNGRILTWNTGAEHLLGWRDDEAVGKSASLVFVPEDIASGEPERELEQARLHGKSKDDRWHLRKDGSRFFASGVLTQVCDEQDRFIGFAKIMRDITATRAQEEQLRESVEQKSMLVREIHHRVKNNLQVIVSLLNLQASHSTDPQVLAAFEESEGRVRAIAQIHERLYASDDLAQVEFAAYLSHLADQLVTLHATAPARVKLTLDVRDLVLHMEQAIPLGLIANELIVNSLKHALKDGPGELNVRLAYLHHSIRPDLGETLDHGWAEIRIADNGPGLPDGLDMTRTDSLGFRLVALLVRQLGAEFEVGDGPGAALTVRFPLKGSPEQSS